MKKSIYIVLGTICVIIAIIGVVLPVLPTTPFIMLGCYFYMHSSKRLYDKIIASELYKKHGKDFIENKQMTRKRKIYIVSFAYFMLLFPLVKLNIGFKFIIIFCYIYIYYYFTVQIKTID